MDVLLRVIRIIYFHNCHGDKKRSACCMQLILSQTPWTPSVHWHSITGGKHRAQAQGQNTGDTHCQRSGIKDA